MADARDVPVWTQHAAEQSQREAYAPGRGEFPDRLVSVLDSEPWSDALDFGCGTGLWRRFFEAGRYVGVDQNPAMVEGARKRWPQDEFVLSVGVSDGVPLPFPDDTFDVAFTSAVLQHSTDADKAGILRELRRVLRPGGRLICFENTFHDGNPGTEDGRSHTQDGWRDLVQPFGFERIFVDRDLHAFRAV